MSKRLVVKLAVTVAALGAMTLLQGCYEEEDGMVVSFAWSPINFVPAARFGFGPSLGGGAVAAGGAAQSAPAAGGGADSGGGRWTGGAGYGMNPGSTTGY
jgi:hypothetical protein